MADEVQISGASGSPQRVDGRDVVYSGPTTRVRPVVSLDLRGADPTFFCQTGSLTSTASRFQFVLYNNNASAIVRVKRVALIPISSTTVTTPVVSGPWTLRLRRGPTTDPSGGTLTISSMDSADSLPSSISAHSAPTTSPSGGTTHDYYSIIPGAIQLGVTSSITNSTTDSLSRRLGFILYSHDELDYGKPLTLRQDQCLEVQQDATAGTMTNYRIHCVFTAF